MYSARATTLLLLARLLPAVLGEELRPGDVPGACNIICGPIITLTNACDIDPAAGNGRQQSETGDDNDGDEAVEAQCVCKNTSFDIGKIASLCAACISQAPPVSGKKTDGELCIDVIPPPGVGQDAHAENRLDMDKIMSQCGFTSTTYTSTDTTAVTGIVVQATRPATGTTAGSNGAGTGATTSTGGTVRPSSTGTSTAGRLSDAENLSLVLTAAGLLGVCMAMW